ncbi:cupin domain-containing protein [Bradyrhizobium manausense]|nr:cupin domain-containing protein [Bradyrhizobium manausense]
MKPKRTAASKLSVEQPRSDAPRIGARLKHARLVNHMRLKDVADAAGCSESMLSKIENERAIPSLTTLHRLCKALDLSVSTLLSSEAAEPWTIMRPEQRKVIGHKKAAGSEGVMAEILVPSAEGRLLEGFLVVIEPGGHTNGTLQHKGEEVGFVVEGQLELTINNEKHLLRAGDSFYFPSDLPHAYRNPGKSQMRAVWINTPPTF